MNDAELQRKLSDMTTDMLVDIIINLLNLLKEMELRMNGDNQKESSCITDFLLRNMCK
jgi:hypothetical protein